MVTQYRKENIDELLSGDHDLYTVKSLIADKLRTVYTLFGWIHMLDTYSKVDDIVDGLTQSALESFKENSFKDVRVGSAGLNVLVYLDYEFICIDYYFSLN